MIMRLDRLIAELPPPSGLIRSFFLETGPRSNKLRVYEAVEEPTGEVAG